LLVTRLFISYGKTASQYFKEAVFFFLTFCFSILDKIVVFDPQSPIDSGLIIKKSPFSTDISLTTARKTPKIAAFDDIKPNNG
jgi:hypothetical protein